MKYTCSICGQSGSADALPEACPACGAESENLWSLRDEVADKLLTSSAASPKPLRHQVFWPALVVLCFISTPLDWDEFNDPLSVSAGGGGQKAEQDQANLETRTPGTPFIKDSGLDRLFAELGKPESESSGGESGGGGGSGSASTGTPTRAMKNDAIPLNEQLGSAVVGKTEQPTAPMQCATPGAVPQPLIFAIDVSVSMGLPFGFPVQDELELDRRIDDGDDAARLTYRAYLQSEGAKRLDLAKSSIETALGQLPNAVRTGVVSFRSCGEIDTLGMAQAVDRRILSDHVKDLKIRRGGETAITEGLAKAREMLGAKGGRIILITDGQETCGSDPCKAHADLADGNIIVDVIDLTGTSKLKCIPAITGGKYYSNPEPVDLKSVSGMFGDAVVQHCGISKGASARQ